MLKASAYREIKEVLVHEVIEAVRCKAACWRKIPNQQIHWEIRIN